MVFQNFHQQIIWLSIFSTFLVFSGKFGKIFSRHFFDKFENAEIFLVEKVDRWFTRWVVKMSFAMPLRCQSIEICRFMYTFPLANDAWFKSVNLNNRWGNMRRFLRRCYDFALFVSSSHLTFSHLHLIYCLSESVKMFYRILHCEWLIMVMNDIIRRLNVKLWTYFSDVLTLDILFKFSAWMVRMEIF